MEYPIPVKPTAQRPIPPTLAILAMSLLLAAPVSAQHESASAASSSSSHASGGSFSSAGSFTHPGSAPTNSGGAHPPHAPTGPIGSHGHPNHHTAQGNTYYGYVYGVPVPYALDVSPTDPSTDEDDDAEYQGGPTIFDRRGSGPDSYVPATYEGPAHNPADEDIPQPPQPPTTLVFKDGRQLEIENYAIVSQTLYDLTPANPRRIALADLDLQATEKQNDDRGIVFQLPPSTQAN